MGEYDQALVEFQKLGQEYPGDSLPLRYEGMTLILLGRLDEAAVTLEKAVSLDTQNPANHYFLARAYHEQGARNKAEKELKEVMELDPEGFYGKPAQDALRVVQERGRYKVTKPWEVFGSTGYEYDSNVKLAPKNSSLRSPGGKGANRYYFNLGGTYKLIDKEKYTTKAGYRIYQSLHDNSLNEFNFTFQEFSLSHEYRTKVRGKEVRWGLRYALPWGFLNGAPFSIGNQITASINARLSKNTRTELFYRYTHYEFRLEGSRPHLTSRDGEYNTIGIFHRYFFSNFSRWVFAGYLLEPINTEGNNFDELGNTIQAGIHSPILSGHLIVDVFGQFAVGNYPRYSTELFPQEPGRLDNDWTFVFSLTYPINANWSIRGQYRLIDAKNRNDIFEYGRQIGGVELLFRY